MNGKFSFDENGDTDERDHVRVQGREERTRTLGCTFQFESILE